MSKDKNSKEFKIKSVFYRGSFVLAICPSCVVQCDVADECLRDCLSGKFRIHLQSGKTSKPARQPWP